MVDEKKLNDVIATTVAKQILETISQEHRDAMLERSITEALKSWSVKHKIEELVAERASVVAAEVIASQAWYGRIREVVVQSIEHYLTHLESAVVLAIEEMMHGKDDGDSYRRFPGIILKHFLKHRKSDKE